MKYLTLLAALCASTATLAIPINIQNAQSDLDKRALGGLGGPPASGGSPLWREKAQVFNKPTEGRTSQWENAQSPPQKPRGRPLRKEKAQFFNKPTVAQTLQGENVQSNLQKPEAGLSSQQKGPGAGAGSGPPPPPPPPPAAKPQPSKQPAGGPAINKPNQLADVKLKKAGERTLKDKPQPAGDKGLATLADIRKAVTGKDKKEKPKKLVEEPKTSVEEPAPAPHQPANANKPAAKPIEYGKDGIPIPPPQPNGANNKPAATKPAPPKEKEPEKKLEQVFQNPVLEKGRAKDTITREPSAEWVRK